MEDVYSVKVKTKPDRRNVYPSERRYSASTVSGLAWVHIALASTSFLLACLALVTPTSDIKPQSDDYEPNSLSMKSNLNDDSFVNNTLTELKLQGNIMSSGNSTDVRIDHILVLAPTMLSLFAMAAGVAAILASVRWYVDRNITWLFVMSVFSTILALTAVIMILTWLATHGHGGEDLSDVINEKSPTEYIVLKHSDIVDRNESHYRVMIKSETTKQESEDNENENSRLFTKKVLAINILIAAFLELLWSLLSIKISYKGMRNNYKEEEAPRGNSVTVITEIKGNNKNIPRNRKLMPRSNLMGYPNSKIRRIFLAQNDNEFYKNQNNKEKQNTETSSEFYKERMMNFLNRCASMEGMSNSEAMPGEDLDPSNSTVNLNPIPEITNVEINTPKEIPTKLESPQKQDEVNSPVTEPDSRRNTLRGITPVSWGDTPEHTIYNQNTLNFEKIFELYTRKKNGGRKSEADKRDRSSVSETKKV